MPHCAKCGAELIGSKKFCAACGTPAGDPRSPAASTGIAPAHVPVASGSAPGGGPSIQYAPAPVSQVNPFAQTAGPMTNSRGVEPLPGAPPRASDYGPPPVSHAPELGTTTPGVGDPSAAPRVSPLAVSNVLSGRGAFENAMTSGPASIQGVSGGLFPAGAASGGGGVTASPDSSSSFRRGGVPGTQLMPSMQNPASLSASTPSGGTPSGPAASTPATRKDRTQLLGAFPPAAPAGGAPAPSAPVLAPAPAPPPAPIAPAPVAPAPIAPAPIAPQPAQPVAWNPVAAPYIPPIAQPAPYAPPYMPPQPPMMPGYGAGYMPGTRVTVTWSNGQRYPGTVQQMSGTQCLVVFPDGQHHWVDMQYVAPA